MDVDAALTFLSFVEERHRAYLARQEDRPQPWTDDPIVASRKFTNVFRLLDFGSQFVLTDLVDPELDPVDQLLRLFLYRHTGRVEAWQYLDITSGYPTRENLDDVVAAWKEYRGDFTWGSGGPSTPGGIRKHKTKNYQRRIFTSAYLVFPQSQVPGTDKFDSIIDLTRRLFMDKPYVGTAFMLAETQAERFATLRQNSGVADFMSMQILTDWGYTTEFRENDFVVAGPGARKGAAALGMQPGPAIDWAWRSIQHLRIGDRSPSKMDAQNTLCEFSKYVRFLEKPAPTKLYKPAHPGPRPAPVLPQHW